MARPPVGAPGDVVLTFAIPAAVVARMAAAARGLFNSPGADDAETITAWVAAQATELMAQWEAQQAVAALDDEVRGLQSQREGRAQAAREKAFRDAAGMGTRSRVPVTPPPSA